MVKLFLSNRDHNYAMNRYDGIKFTWFSSYKRIKGAMILHIITATKTWIVNKLVMQNNRDVVQHLLFTKVKRTNLI